MVKKTILPLPVTFASDRWSKIEINTTIDDKIVMSYERDKYNDNQQWVKKI